MCYKVLYFQARSLNPYDGNGNNGKTRANTSPLTKVKCVLKLLKCSRLS